MFCVEMGSEKSNLLLESENVRQKVLKNDENYNGGVCAAGRALAATTKGSYLLEAL